MSDAKKRPRNATTNPSTQSSSKKQRINTAKDKSDKGKAQLDDIFGDLTKPAQTSDSKMSSTVKEAQGKGSIDVSTPQVTLISAQKLKAKMNKKKDNATNSDEDKWPEIPLAKDFFHIRPSGKSRVSLSNANTNDDDDMGFIEKSTVNRKTTEEGFKVYTYDELRFEEGGDTPLCPFDCDCCYA